MGRNNVRVALCTRYKIDLRYVISIFVFKQRETIVVILHRVEMKMLGAITSNDEGENGIEERGTIEKCKGRDDTFMKCEERDGDRNMICNLEKYV